MRALLVYTTPLSLVYVACHIPHSLGLSAPKPVQKVAIIGSGIAGLSTAHALVSSAALSGDELPIDVTIFDARPGLDREVGSGVQLNGALSVLRQINPNLLKAVMDAGRSLEKVQSRSKPWSDDKPYETLLELPLRKIVQEAGGATAAALLNANGELLWTSIMRGALQETLFENLPSSTKSKVQFRKLLTGLTTEGEGVRCVFADGSETESFDLVIGCDGIKSAVKEFVDTGKITPNPQDREGVAAGIYTGLRLKYAVDLAIGKDEEGPPVLTQYFGDSAYCFSGVFGNGKGRPYAKGAFITYLDDNYIGPIKKKKQQSEVVNENADWSQDNRQDVERSRQLMLQKIVDAGVPGDELRETILKADRFFDLGVYAHNPFCSWSRKLVGSNSAYVVLAGDAAHAFPPFLGQGANQAVQDAWSLGKRIKEFNEQVRQQADVDLGAVLKDYEKTRWGPAFQIFWKAAFLGYLETGGVDGLYSKFRDIFFKTTGALGVAKKILLGAATPQV